MNRNQLKQLSKIRLKEAKILFEKECYDGAYYLAGYSIECAIKACIAKQVRIHDFPDKELANKSYSHNLGELLKVAGLDVHRKNEEDLNADFAVNWSVVQRWRETSRYEFRIKQDAEDILTSITTKTGGILKWIQQYW